MKPIFNNIDKYLNTLIKGKERGEMSKITLIIVGILVAVMGILGVIPGISLGTEPVWHAIVKIIIGLIAIIIGLADKKRA